uniref:Uncharacterized protein n=1 Tax=Anguilla anguilla TaxID=7936 RepID=A0A0E9UJ71_ANGAN
MFMKRLMIVEFFQSNVNDFFFLLMSGKQKVSN